MQNLLHIHSDNLLHAFTEILKIKTEKQEIFRLPKNLKKALKYY